MGPIQTKYTADVEMPPVGASDVSRNSPPYLLVVYGLNLAMVNVVAKQEEIEHRDLIESGMWSFQICAAIRRQKKR